MYRRHSINVNRTLLAWLGLAVWLIAMPSVALAAVWYVKPSATGSASGADWANAITLQGALATAASGDELWVAAGIYKPDEGPGQTDNNSNSTFNIRSGLAVYGGFAGSEQALSERNWTANITVLSGDIDGNDTNTDNNFIAETTASIVGTNALHVVTMNGTPSAPITANTRLDGLTITAGNAANNYGGGFICNGPGAGNNCSPALTNVTFSGNTAAYGGAMYNYGGYSGTSSPTLTNVTFSGNTASYTGAGSGHAYGGAMYNYGYAGTSSPTLTNVTFSGNTASGVGYGYSYVSCGWGCYTYYASGYGYGYGGAMYNYGYAGTSSPTLTNVTFSGNTASGIGTNNGYSSSGYGYGYGGAISNESSSPTLTNVTFSGNTASGTGTNGSESYGGAMYNWGNSGPSNPTLTNSILWGNTALTGAQIFNANATPIITYSVVQGSYPGVYPGTGNIDTNPLLGPLQNNGGTTLTQALDASSLAINAGDPNTSCPATDQRGYSRPAGGRCDIGAYEFGGTLTLLAAAPSPAVYGQTVTLTATVSPNTAPGTVAFKDGGNALPCAGGNQTLSGGTATCTTTPTALTAGTHSALTAIYSGDSTFATSQGTTRLTVNKADQATLTVTGPTSAVFGQPNVAAETTGGNGTGAVTYSAGGSTACSVDAGSGAVSITSGTGICAITATKAADSNYNASAASAPHVISISPAPQATLTVTGLPLAAVFNQPSIVAGTNGGSVAGGAINYSSGSSTACSVVAGTGAVTITSGTGNCAITATKAGDANYLAVTSAPVSITISKADQTITFDQPVDQNLGVGTVNLDVSTTSLLTVTVASTSLGVCSVSDTTVTLLTPGLCNLTASQSGNANYNAATSVNRTFTIIAIPTTTTVTTVTPASGVYGEPVSLTATVTANVGSTAPGGTVALTVDGKTCSAALGSAVGTTATVTCALDATSGFPAVGSNLPVTAVYSPGTSSFVTSSSSGAGNGSLTVTAATTTTTLTTNPTTSTAGGAVDLKAQINPVSPSVAIPTGTVAFSAGGSPIADCLAIAVDSSTGLATCAHGFTTSGTKTLAASYTPAAGGLFHPSALVNVPHEVNSAVSTTMIQSVTPTVGDYGIAPTVSVQVTGSAGPPTGTVIVAAGSIQCTAPLNNAGLGSCALTPPAGNPTTLTATYQGDATYGGSSDTTSAVITPVTPVISVTSAPNPSSVGAGVTLTATLAKASTTAEFPTGNVEFSRDRTPIAGCSGINAVTLAGGIATCAESFAATGNYAIEATTTGDSNYSAGAQTATHEVVVAATTTAIAPIDPASVVYGTAIPVSVTVTGATSPGSPTGTVTVTAGGQSCTATLTAATSPTSTGSCTLTTVPSGNSQTVTATYNGSLVYGGSIATDTVTVTPATTATALSSSVNPAPVGTAVTFIATVTSPSAAGHPTTGSVTFTLDGTAQPPVALSGNTATFSPTSLTVGDHTLTAAYGATTNYQASAANPALTQTVGKIATAVALTSSQNPSTDGQSVTFTATVSGTPTPTGTVSFTTDGTAITGCTAKALTSGATSCATAGLTVGNRAIAALYSGDNTYVTSTGNLTQMVNSSGGGEIPGYGSTPIPGATLTFGPVAIGATTTQTLTIRNTGNAQLAVSPVTLSGTNASDFTPPNLTQFTLAPAAVQTLTLACTPTVAGIRTATLTIGHNAAGSPASYPLSCSTSLIEHRLSVAALGSGTGSVTSNPAGISCGAVCSALFAETALVTLTAQPDTTATFLGWGGDCSGASCALTLSQDRSVTARFEPKCGSFAPPDSDGDGIPDAVEPSVQTDPCVRDNDVFTRIDLAVMQDYRDLLRREADTGGRAYWQGLLASNTLDRAGLIDAMITGLSRAEFQAVTGIIPRLYHATFNRSPDLGGFDYWRGQLRAGLPERAFADVLAESAEFQTQVGTLTDAQYVDWLYRHVLNREPDAAGQAFWLDWLTRGILIRGDLLLLFADSPEYQTLTTPEVLLDTLYLALLRQAADPTGYDHWLGLLQSGADRGAVIAVFLAQPGYRARFLP